MAPRQDDDKKNADFTQQNAPDVAIGTMEGTTEHIRLPWTPKTFFRSVLLQMVLFGL